MTFNLVDEPWLPVRRGAESQLVDLRTALLEPERFEGLETEEVDELFALVRLLTTILNRSLDGPRTGGDWAKIAAGPGYDRGRIASYLDCWRHRFELFDPERPFLQFAELAGKKAASPLVLLPSAASGNSVTLFSHRAERDGVTLTPARAARALVHVVLNGRGALKGGEYGVHGARLVVLGPTLRDVLVENLPPYRGPADDGLPVWEQDEPRRLPSDPRKTPQPCRGLLDLATWQWRAVHLRLDDGLVRTCAFGPAPPPDGEEPVDPARWYRYPSEAERAKKPKLGAREDRRLRADREVWRDADALVAAVASRATPGVLAWNIDHREAPVFDVLVGGPIVELKGSWVLTGLRTASLPLPRELFSDERLVARVGEAVAAASARAQDLRRAVFAAARELVRQGHAEQPSRKRAGAVASTLDAGVGYWAALPGHFDQVLRDIADHASFDRWQAAVDDAAREALGEATGSLTTPRGLRAAAAAWRSLEFAIRNTGTKGVASA